MKMFCYAGSMICCAALLWGAEASATEHGKTLLERSLDATRQAADPVQTRERRLRQEEAQAVELEAFFLQKMLEDAFPKGEGAIGLYGGGPGSDIYRSMVVEHAARAWSKRGGIGLAERMLEQARARRGELPPKRAGAFIARRAQQAMTNGGSDAR